MKILKMTSLMATMMQEPEVHRTNLGAISVTSEETASFRQDPLDVDSSAEIMREKTYNANGDFIDQTIWGVMNAPTIVSVVTDMTDDQSLVDGQLVTAVITGTTLAPKAADLEIYLVVPAKNRTSNLPAAPSGDTRVPGIIESGDDPLELTYTVKFNLKAPSKYRLLAGDCRLVVVNSRRMIEGDPYTLKMISK